MNNTKENFLGTEKIGKLLLTYSVPGIVSMLVNSIYNLVDQVFIGRGVGFLGNGATTVSFPFTQMLLALSLMTAAGTAANAGLNLGRKQQHEADHFIANGFTLAIFWGFLLLIVCELFMLPLLNLFGATEDNLPYAISYSRVVLLGFPFVTTGVCMNDVIRADGAPRYAMISMLAGAITNIILDPVFIFICHWGVAGAAFATILGQIITFCMSFAKFKKLKTMTLKREYMPPQPDRIRRIIVIGMAAFLTQIAMMFSNILLNNTAAKYGAMSIYGADIPITCFGVNGKIVALMMSVILGITSSTQPIIAFNYGAALYPRVREIVKKACFVTFVVGIIGFIGFHVFPQQVINLFGQESELYNEFAVTCLKTMTLTIFVMGIPMQAGTYFQSVGMPVQATILNLSRQLLFLVPMILILPMLFGVRGLMFCYPSADVFSIILAAVLLTREMKRLHKLENGRQQ